MIIGRILLLSKCSFEWLITNIRADCDIEDECMVKIRSPSFEIPAFQNTLSYLTLEMFLPDLYFYIRGLPNSLELSEIAITFIDPDYDEVISKCCTRKRSATDYVSIELSDDSNEIIYGYLIDWCRNIKIRCELNCPSHNCEIIKEPELHENKFSHTSEALEQFESLLDNSEFSDIKFVVQGKTLHAHKSILAARSSVFMAMMKHQMQETELSVINIDDMSYDVLKEMLRYIYSGKIEQIDGIAKELFVAADKYDIVKLRDECEKRLCNSLTAGNAIEYLNLAYLHSIEKLRAMAMRFIINNGKAMVNDPSFDSLADLNKELILEVFRNLMLCDNDK